MKANTRLFDIAANLADDRYKLDLQNVLARAKQYGVEKMLFGGTYIKDSQRSHELSLLDPNYYCTVGIHPCRACQPTVEKKSLEEYFSELETVIQNCKKGKLIAIGECGLDYDRFEYADKESQLKYESKI